MPSALICSLSTCCSMFARLLLLNRNWWPRGRFRAASLDSACDSKSRKMLALCRIRAGESSARRRYISRQAPTEREDRSEEHTSELRSPCNLVCRLLLEKTGRDLKQTPWSASLVGGRDRPALAVIAYNAEYPRRPVLFFFFNDTATTEIYTLSLHDALSI